MKIINKRTTLAFLSALTLSATSSLAYSTNNNVYEVTITNLTRGQAFTPILVASHRRGVELFELGAPASDELIAIAEGGDIAPMTELLNNNNRVVDVDHSEGLLEPGQSVTVKVDATHNARRISLASMMLPTNDGFIALNNVQAPRHGRTVSYLSPGYDAGSETNDESCINIPGPYCGGAPASPADPGEGYVHINGGIHGIADLDAAMFDWRNPVAKITIRRVRSHN